VLITEEMGRPQEAVDKLQIILKNYPDDVDLRIFAAKYFLDRRLWDLAEQTLNLLSRLNDSRRAEFLTGLAVISVRRDHNTAAAEQLLKEALKVNPNFKEASGLLDQLRELEKAPGVSQSTNLLKTSPTTATLP